MGNSYLLCIAIGNAKSFRCFFSPQVVPTSGWEVCKEVLGPKLMMIGKCTIWTSVGETGPQHWTLASGCFPTFFARKEGERKKNKSKTETSQKIGDFSNYSLIYLIFHSVHNTSPTTNEKTTINKQKKHTTWCFFHGWLNPTFQATTASNLLQSESQSHKLQSFRTSRKPSGFTIRKCMEFRCPHKGFLCISFLHSHDFSYSWCLWTMLGSTACRVWIMQVFNCGMSSSSQ